MKEKLLHFIWKLQMFSSKKLFTSEGEKLEIISPGVQNFNTGPDFANAKIRINNQLWYGAVEIHVKASDWYLHHHEKDSNYDGVILHVVWEYDVEIFRKTAQPIETLELKKLISPQVLNNYKSLFNKNKNWINCENEIASINTFKISSWLERLSFERLEQKTGKISKILKLNNNDWEATLFVLLTENFGLKINSAAFYNLAMSFDFSILRKIAANNQEIEALLFGQSGLLAEDTLESNYYLNLKATYDYLKIKYKLKPVFNNQIQFFRLRPHNFPTIRLSQLSKLYGKHQNLFSAILEFNKLEEYYDFFNVKTSIFWETHFTFKKESKKSIKYISKSFIDLLLINSILPLKFVYLKSRGVHDFSSIISILENIKPEKNTIISKFKELNIATSSAFQTQALLQLKNEYCENQKCLNCTIGKEILKN